MPIKLSPHVAQLPIASVPETQRYYHNVLGFQIDWIWEDGYGSVSRDHQGRGIGTALMNEVVAFIRRAAPPKALVGLFTGANRGTFYERFGFKGPEIGLYGMSVLELQPAHGGKI